MTGLFMLCVSLAQRGQSIELPGVNVVSVRVGVTVESEFSTHEYSIFELSGKNLDSSFHETDSTSRVLVVGASPCFYVRSQPRKGWCVVRRKVDFAKESIWGPVAVNAGELYKPTASSELSKPDLTVRPLKNVAVLAPVRFETYADLLTELSKTPKDERKP